MNLSRNTLGRLTIFAVFLIFIFYAVMNYNVTDDEVKMLIEQAKSGNTDAQFRLVKSYGQGIGVLKNQAKAKYWFSIAAQNGHAEAQYWMGYKYYYGEGEEKDINKAIEWYERSANQGYGPAQFMAGYVQQMGDLAGGNLKPDISKAIYWYQLAVAKNEMGAQFHLGCFKYFGIGIAKDSIEAETLIVNAANRGHRGAEKFMQDKGTDGKTRLMVCEIYPNIHIPSQQSEIQ